MQKIKLGTKVQNLGINRAEVAENVLARAVLIDPDPCVKFLGWDDKRKRAVEVDQDMIIKYGFRPMTRYYYLVARLNTDMTGTIIGDKFQIEYIQMSDNQNSDFATAVNEMGNFKTLAIQKVKKAGPAGKDFSYLKITPSNQEAPAGVLEAIEKMRTQPQAIDAMWKIIDSSTSLTKAQYVQLLAEESGAAQAAPQIQSGAQARPQIGFVAAPEPNEIPGNDFGKGDDFSDM
jgi:hypothetical protein